MTEKCPEQVLVKLQQVEHEILDACAEVCEKLEIRSWFIDSGTCLGAVRHKGFIPWDDDIDIAMAISDYRHFIEHAADLLPEGFGIYTPADTDEYQPLWAKVYKKGTRFIDDTTCDTAFVSGIFVDVFAYMRLDSDEKTAKKQIALASKWQKMSYLYHTSHIKLPFNARFKPVLRVGCTVAHAIVHAVYSPQTIYRNFEEVCEMGDQKGDWINVFYADWGPWPTESLFPTSRLEFCGKLYPAPHDPDSYLRITYGDYMKLPPEEERIGHAPMILDFGDGKNAMEEAVG